MARGGLIGNLYRPLNQRQIETIHQKSLDVIEHIGLTLFNFRPYLAFYS
jgi:trimethylamine:corrinoid methyltransferase-like protein